MKKLLWSAPVLFFLIACDKDKFQTKPQISLKSITDYVPFQGILEVSLTFTDKEGDLGEGTLFYLPVLQNVRPLAPSIPLPPYDTVRYPIPEFPEKSKGEMKLNLNRNDIYKEIQQRGGTDKNDTLIFRIYVRDKAGNTSDTLITSKVVVQG
jgi:hypothetical protein